MKALKDLAEKLGSTPREQRERAVQTQVLEIGTALRAARLKKGWSQTELAEHSDVAQPEISRIENGTFQQGPTSVTLCRLALALSAQVSLAPLDAEPEEAESDSALGLEDDDSDVQQIRRAIRKELAVLLSPIGQRDFLICGYGANSDAEVKLVPIMTKYLNETVYSDLEKLAKDVGQSIEQTKIGAK